MIPALLAHLSARWSELGLPGEPPATGAVVGPDTAPDAKVVIFLYDPDGVPVVVVKTGRTAAADNRLRQEHEILSGFWAAGLQSRIPRPLDLTEIDGRTVLLQTALPGRPMTALYHTTGHVSSERAVRADFEAAADWLGHFHRQTAAAPVSVEEWRTTDYAALMKGYRAKVGYNGREEPLFALIEDRMTALRDEKIPRTGVHGDFWMGNLITDVADRTTVVTGALGWRRGAPLGTPIQDIYRFPTSYGFDLDRTAPPQAQGRIRNHAGREDLPGRWRSYHEWPHMIGFGHTYFAGADGRPGGWFQKTVESYVRSCEAVLGIDPALTPVLFAAYLIDQAQNSPDAETRDGWRAAIAAFMEERERTWIWTG